MSVFLPARFLHDVMCPQQQPMRQTRSGRAQHAVRVKHKLAGHTRVKFLVTLRGIFQRNDLRVDDLGNIETTVQDGLHQLAIVLNHRCLAGMEGVSLRPAQAKAQTQAAGLGGFSVAPWSSVTYRPGIPMEPPSRVTSII